MLTLTEDTGRVVMHRLEKESSSSNPIPIKVANWLFAVKCFRDFEEIKTILNTPTEIEIQNLRAMLTVFLGIGEDLLLEILEHPEVDLSLIGTNKEIFESYLQEMRDKYAMWAMPMTKEQAHQILEGLNVSK